MRAVVQRVREASVTVDGRPVSRIGRGLLVLLGVASGDDGRSAAAMAEKIAHLRVFPDSEDRMNRSVLDLGGEVLLVSQFTLLGDCRKGRRPSFDRAMEPAAARRLCEEVVARLRSLGLRVGEGEFGARMEVALVNDGPVTLLLDTERTF